MEKTYYDDFYKPFFSYDGSMMHIDNALESAILEYTEFVLEEHYITESTNTNLWTKVKQFFTKLILSMKNFIADLDIQIQTKIKEKELKNTLLSLKEEIKNKQESGEKNVSMIDYWKYKNLYLSLNRELYGYAKKFAKVKYTKVYQIEDDMNEFNDIIKEYSEKMQEVSTIKIKVPIKKALTFVESELQGRSDVLKTLNDSIGEFREIEQIAENMRTKMALLGNDVIPKHVGMIEKMVNAISSFIRKWTTRFIVGIVFIFA